MNSRRANSPPLPLPGPKMNNTARLARLEAQRKNMRSSSPSVAVAEYCSAVVNVIDMTPVEAEKAIDDKRRELDAAGFAGYLVIVDA